MPEITPTISVQQAARPPQKTKKKRLLYGVLAGSASLICILVAMLVGLNSTGSKEKKDSNESSKQAATQLKVVKRVGSPSEWLQDEYLRLQLVAPIRGPLLKDGQYDVSLAVQSLSDERMDISEIVLEVHNADAAARLGYANSRVHTSTRRPETGQAMFLDPHERQTIPMAGAQVLPDTLVLKIAHNLGSGESQFRIENAGEQSPMPRARRLPNAVIYRGVDGIDAIAPASKAAKAWSNDAIFYRAHTLERSIVNDPMSNLSYVVANGWVVEFYSHSRRGLLSVHVLDGQTQISERTDVHVDSQPAPLPTIGIHQAIDLASKNNLLCANWNGEQLSQLSADMRNPRLRQVSIDGHPAYVWFLPYLGPESVPIVVDALTGDEVRMVQGAFQRFALTAKPPSSGDAPPKSAEVKWDTRLRDFLNQTLSTGFDSRLGRMIYSDVTTAIDTGKSGSWGVGWGPTKDGRAHLINVSGGAWFETSLAPAEATKKDITENTVLRSVDRTFRMRDIQLAKLSNAKLQLVTGTDGRRFVRGTVSSSSTSGIDVADLTIVLRSFLKTGNVSGTRDLFQNLDGKAVPNGVLNVEVEVLGGSEVDPLSGAHIFLQAFVVSGRPAYYRISNELPCEIQAPPTNR